VNDTLGAKPPGGLPPTQHKFRTAMDKAIEALRGQRGEQLTWLGAAVEGRARRVVVLGEAIQVDLAGGEVTTLTGQAVSPPWRILLLHYLAVADRPTAGPPEVTFADLPAARAYAGIYRQRVIAPFCARAGQEAGTFAAAAAALAGRAVSGGDLAFEFDVFPRLAVRMLWHAADEEFGPSATLLLPRNIEAFLCIEDIVVLSERLVSRLSGRPF